MKLLLLPLFPLLVSLPLALPYYHMKDYTGLSVIPRGYRVGRDICMPSKLPSSLERVRKELRTPPAPVCSPGDSGRTLFNQHAARTEHHHQALSLPSSL